MSVLPMLAVKDFETSAKFYTDKLGFTLDFSMPMPGGSTFGIISLTKGVQIGLGTVEGDFERGRGVSLMLYPDDFDIDAHYELLRSRGVEIHKEIRTEPWGDRVFEVNDPDGYNLAFARTVEQVAPEVALERINQQAAG